MSLQSYNTTYPRIWIREVGSEPGFILEQYDIIGERIRRRRGRIRLRSDDYTRMLALASENSGAIGKLKCDSRFRTRGFEYKIIRYSF